LRWRAEHPAQDIRIAADTAVSVDGEIEFAVTQKGVTGVVLDPSGFLHYFTLLR
jgi:hypothetical protein